ncbi:MAG: hypothetical protein MK052_05475 [Alphaproteobacteria bacterium]|nr:hypothetical protein [Alphaproteobacteria bacterium]
MKNILIAFGLILATLMPVHTAMARGYEIPEVKSKIIKDDVNDLVHMRHVVKENEIFATAHPREAKKCYGALMEAAEAQQVAKHEYFLKHQKYYRNCIEHLVYAK